VTRKSGSVGSRPSYLGATYLSYDFSCLKTLSSRPPIFNTWHDNYPETRGMGVWTQRAY